MFDFLDVLGSDGGAMGALAAPKRPCIREQRKVKKLTVKQARETRARDRAAQRYNKCASRGRKCMGQKRALDRASMRLSSTGSQLSSAQALLNACSISAPTTQVRPGTPGAHPTIPGVTYTPPTYQSPWAGGKSCRGNKVQYVMPNGRIRCVTLKSKQKMDCKAQGGRFRGGRCIPGAQVVTPGLPPVGPGVPPSISAPKTCRGNKVPYTLPTGRVRCVTPKRRDRLECMSSGGRYKQGQCLTPTGPVTMPGGTPVGPTVKQCKGNKTPFMMPNGKVRCVTDKRIERLECKMEGGKWKRGDCVFPSEDFGPDTFYQPPTLFTPTVFDDVPAAVPGEPVDVSALEDFNFACAEIGGRFSVQGNPPSGVCAHQGQNYTDINMLPDPSFNNFYDEMAPEEECAWQGGFFYDGKCNAYPRDTPTPEAPAPLPETGPGLITPIDSGVVDPFAGGGAPAMSFEGPLLEELPEGFEEQRAPLFSAPMQVGMNECDPAFNEVLPLEYSDDYGPMMVLQVVCANTGAVQPSGGGGNGDDAFGATPIGPVETAELDTLTEGDLF